MVFVQYYDISYKENSTTQRNSDNLNTKLVFHQNDSVLTPNLFPWSYEPRDIKNCVDLCFCLKRDLKKPLFMLYTWLVVLLCLSDLNMMEGMLNKDNG